MSKMPEIFVLDNHGKANLETAVAIYKQASDVAKKIGCDVSEVFDAMGYSPKEHIKAMGRYSVPQIHRYLGAVNEKMRQIDGGVPILGPNASPEQIEAVYDALKREKGTLLQDLLVSQDMMSEEFATEKYSEAQKLLKIISTGNLAIVDDIEKDAKENVKAGRGKTILYVTLAALIAAGVGISGCLTSADTAAKEKATEKTLTQQYGDAPSPTGTPADAAQSDVKVPWLIEKKGIMGKYYEIDREKLPLNGAGLKLVAGNDNKYDDGEMIVGDGVPELMAGIDVANNQVIVVADQDFFAQYPSLVKRLSNENNGNPGYIGKKRFIEAAPGVYYVGVPIDGNDQMDFVGKMEAKNPEELKVIPIIAFEKK